MTLESAEIMEILGYLYTVISKSDHAHDFLERAIKIRNMICI